MRTKTKNEIKALVKPYVEVVNQVGENSLSPVWAIKDILGAVYSSQKQIHFQDFRKRSTRGKSTINPISFRKDLQES